MDARPAADDVMAVFVDRHDDRQRRDKGDGRPEITAKCRNQADTIHVFLPFFLPDAYCARCLCPSEMVHREHILKGGRGISKAILARKAGKCVFHDRRHFGKADGPGDKVIERHFFGGVEGGSGHAAQRHHLARKAQGGKARRIRGLKRQAGKAGKVKPLHRHIAAFRPMQRIADGMAHIGGAKMRHDAAIAKPDQRVNDGLRMHQHLDLIR